MHADAVPRASRGPDARRIDTWDDFRAWCATRDGWAFRGEADASWPLVSSLARRLIDAGVPREQWRQREERAIRVFRRKAHVYLPDRTVLHDDLRCLAIMQHHGAPTRLLDFTKSPYVAAFFAFEPAPLVSTDSAIYALNTPRLWAAAPRFDPTLTRDEVDPRLPGRFERYFGPNRHPIVWFGEPAEMDRRLVAQSGLLVVPGVVETDLATLLTGYGSSEPLLEKVVLAGGLRRRALHELYRMNLTQATLFPDLEGLARSIAYELEEVWPIDGGA